MAFLSVVLGLRVDSKGTEMKKFRTTMATVASLAFATLGLSACGTGSSSITVGYSTYTLSNPYFAGMVKGMREGAAAHRYNLVITNANGSAAQQVTDIENLIARGVSYIVLTPADGKALTPAIEAANRAHVPVISVPDRVDAPVAAMMPMDEVQNGIEAADYLVSALKQRYGKPEGQIVEIEGIAGIPSAESRKQGFESTIAKYPNVHIVAAQDGGYDTNKSYQVMTPILQAHPHIDAVFATNDAEAIGVTAAIKAQGLFQPVGSRNHIILVGEDGSAPSIQDIRAGIQDATVSSNPILFAQKAIGFVADLAAGHTIPKLTIMPTQLITRANINSPAVKQYGIWADEL